MPAQDGRGEDEAGQTGGITGHATVQQHPCQRIVGTKRDARGAMPVFAPQWLRRGGRACQSWQGQGDTAPAAFPDQCRSQGGKSRCALTRGTAVDQFRDQVGQP